MHTTEPASPAMTSQAEIVARQLAELGLSVSEFGRRLEVAPSYISNVLRGTKRLTNDDTIQRAAEILGISVDPLYLAINRIPLDVLRHMQIHPILLDVVRMLNAKLATQNAQAASPEPAQPAPALQAHVP